MTTLFWLIVTHFLADFPLQGDWLAVHKNPHQLYDYGRAKPPKGEWIWAMSAHCLIQGGGVALVTGSVWLGIFETIGHWCIDTAKCKGLIGFNVDQVLHLWCRVIWWWLWTVIPA
jgi:hypothetical protein